MEHTDRRRRIEPEFELLLCRTIVLGVEDRTHSSKTLSADLAGFIAEFPWVRLVCVAESKVCLLHVDILSRGCDSVGFPSSEDPDALSMGSGTARSVGSVKVNDGAGGRIAPGAFLVVEVVSEGRRLAFDDPLLRVPQPIDRLMVVPRCALERTEGVSIVVGRAHRAAARSNFVGYG